MFDRKNLENHTALQASKLFMLAFPQKAKDTKNQLKLPEQAVKFNSCHKKTGCNAYSLFVYMLAYISIHNTASLFNSFVHPNPQNKENTQPFQKTSSELGVEALQSLKSLWYHYYSASFDKVQKEYKQPKGQEQEKK